MWQLREWQHIVARGHTLDENWRTKSKACHSLVYFGTTNLHFSLHLSNEIFKIATVTNNYIPTSSTLNSLLNFYTNDGHVHR